MEWVYNGTNSEAQKVQEAEEHLGRTAPEKKYLILLLWFLNLLEMKVLKKTAVFGVKPFCI